MEARLLVGMTGALLAFTCAFAATQSIAATLRGRQASMTAQGDSLSASGLIAWRLRNGFPCAARVVALVGRLRIVADALDEGVVSCAEHGMAATRESLGSTAVVALAVLAAVSGIAAASPVAALAVLACALAVLLTIAGHAHDKRREAVREAVPEALESMAACLGTGYTLLQTFDQVSKEVPGPLGETFARSAHVLEVGGSAERALEELREGSQASELAFVAVALDVQHQTGGAMRQVIEAASDTVKGELALKRSLRVQTAQAKLSARIVVIMPFLLVAAFSLASPGFLAPFFSSAFGYALLAVAIVMQVLGIVLVRRALAVEGVS